MLKSYQLTEQDKGRLRLWTAALRSDRFQQGYGLLAYINKTTYQWLHCCLGVMCEVAIENGAQVDTEKSTAFGTIVKRFDGSHVTPPWSVRHWFGLSGDPLMLGNGAKGHPASVYNDNLRLSFPQIADLIDAEYGLVPDDATEGAQ